MGEITQTAITLHHILTKNYCATLAKWRDADVRAEGRGCRGDGGGEGEWHSVWGVAGRGHFRMGGI